MSNYVLRITNRRYLSAFGEFYHSDFIIRSSYFQ